MVGLLRYGHSLIEISSTYLKRVLSVEVCDKVPGLPDSVTDFYCLLLNMMIFPVHWKLMKLFLSKMKILCL